MGISIRRILTENQTCHLITLTMKDSSQKELSLNLEFLAGIMPYSTIQIHSQKLLDTWGDLSTFKTETKGKKKQEKLIQYKEEKKISKIKFITILFFKKELREDTVAIK